MRGACGGVGACNGGVVNRCVGGGCGEGTRRGLQRSSAAGVSGLKGIR